MSVHWLCLCLFRGTTEDHAQPTAGPGRRTGLLQAPAARQQWGEVEAATDGALALLLVTLWLGVVGRQQGQLLQWHQERSGDRLWECASVWKRDVYVVRSSCCSPFVLSWCLSIVFCSPLSPHSPSLSPYCPGCTVLGVQYEDNLQLRV